jgi:hypothetical protein
MRTIIKPNTPALIQWTCDVTGSPLPQGPAATITIKGGFGAPYDGDTFLLDLSEPAAEVVLPLFRVLLLGGGPLAPHLLDSVFPGDHQPERRITRRALPSLLRRLQELRARGKP